MIGMILGNRYEILKEIGSGGMANVYLAQCRLLNRYVAVKVLKTEFANDKEFLERFNKEAQAAAAISSPNIVNVYDVGHDGDIHYIVMEYVEGQTLKEYIDRSGMLSWQETVEYAIQICSALDKAHKNGVIHRDIKPQNIILTNEGVLKVTDFGIARATSTDTLNVGESTMGSVHYFSPEQARGGYTDEKSDLYSLGIVMYELVTGILPFDGDSPIAIAIKHMQIKPVSPKEFNISVPLAVEAIILKAMSKEQHLRYQTAEEMLADLNRVINNPDTVPADDIHRGDTIKIDPVEDIPVNLDFESEPKEPVRRKVSGGKKMTNKKKKEPNSDNKGVKKAVILAILSAFAVFGLTILITLGALNGCSKEIEIPDLVGMTYEDAVEKYGDDFTITIERNVESDEYPPGYIVDQDPSGGRTTKSKKEINVAVSKDSESFVMGDFEGKTLEYVMGSLQQEIDEYDLRVEVVEEESTELEKDMVIKTLPTKNAKVKKGDKITIYVSMGKAVTMPDLVGLTLGEAKKKISESKLELGEITPRDATDDYIVEWQSVESFVNVLEAEKINLRLKDNGEGATSGDAPANSNQNGGEANGGSSETTTPSESGNNVVNPNVQTSDTGL